MLRKPILDFIARSYRRENHCSLKILYYDNTKAYRHCCLDMWKCFKELLLTRKTSLCSIEALTAITPFQWFCRHSVIFHLIQLNLRLSSSKKKLHGRALWRKHLLKFSTFWLKQDVKHAHPSQMIIIVLHHEVYLLLYSTQILMDNIWYSLVVWWVVYFQLPARASSFIGLYD